MARILILTPQVPFPPHQGTTIRNYNLIAGLAQRHTVDLLTFVASGGGQEPASAGASPLVRYCRRIIEHPAPARTLARRARDTLMSSMPDMALRLASPAMYASVDEVLRRERYDIVQVEGIEMAPYILERVQHRATAGALSKARLVFDDHNAEYVLQKRAFLNDSRRPRRWVAAAYSAVQWQKLAAYERRVCRTADRVVAVSEADRRALLRLDAGLEVMVIPNGVDLELYQPGSVGPAPGLPANALVFSGKMDYRPNVDAVVWFANAVLPLIREQVPDACFFVVGQQPVPVIQALGERPGVKVTGWVPDVRPYIAGAGVCVVPLRIGGGTRLKVLEAMAMGQAIVSTSLGCDGFPFQDGREVSFADDPTTFATRVVALLHDKDAAAQLGCRARACVEAYYGWNAIVPLLEKVYA